MILLHSNEAACACNQLSLDKRKVKYSFLKNILEY